MIIYLKVLLRESSLLCEILGLVVEDPNLIPPTEQIRVYGAEVGFILLYADPCLVPTQEYLVKKTIKICLFKIRTGHIIEFNFNKKYLFGR